MIKQMFIDALRSGKYEQGFGTLYKNGRHCPEGVLCELYLDKHQDKSNDHYPVKIDWKDPSVIPNNAYSNYPKQENFICESCNQVKQEEYGEACYKWEDEQEYLSLEEDLDDLKKSDRYAFQLFGRRYNLPEEVAIWAGINTNKFYVNGCPLQNLNDIFKYTFKEIAQMIEDDKLL